MTREAFEKWARDEELPVERHEALGIYQSLGVENMWAGWLAATAAAEAKQERLREAAQVAHDAADRLLVVSDKTAHGTGYEAAAEAYNRQSDNLRQALRARGDGGGE